MSHPDQPYTPSTDDELREKIALTLHDQGAFCGSCDYENAIYDPDEDGLVEWRCAHCDKCLHRYADAALLLIASEREAAVFDYVSRKEVAKVKIEFTNQPMFDDLIASVRRDAQAEALDTAAAAIRIEQVERLDFTAENWWAGMADAQQILHDRAADIRRGAGEETL